MESNFSQNFGQKLSEDEIRANMSNRNLQLTLKGELQRLRKVIEEKNAIIAKFKKYDEERKAYYSKFEKNYKLMQERFSELADAVNDCDGLDYGTKEFFQSVFERLSRGKMSNDNARMALLSSIKKLMKMQDSFSDMEACILSVSSEQDKEELLFVLRKMKVRYDNITSSFQKKMNELK